MAISYSVYEVQELPDITVGESIVPPRQMSLDETMRESPPITEFRLDRTIDELSTHVFTCVHEFRVNRAGRYGNISFPYYIEKQHFTSYYVKQPRLLLVKANKDVAIDAIRTLIHHPSVKMSARVIDLDSIRALINHGLKAGYISVDNSPDVKSVAFFGPSIDQDARYENALLDGKMYYARLNYEHGGAYYHIGVTETSNLTIYDSYLDEHSELRLVLDIKHQLLDQALEKG